MYNFYSYIQFVLDIYVAEQIYMIVIALAILYNSLDAAC